MRHSHLARLLAPSLACVLAACAGVSLPGHHAAKAGDPDPATARLQASMGGVNGYLPRTAYPDGAAILGPPPTADSPQGRADAAIFEQTRALEGSSRWVQAARDADLNGPAAFRSLACAAGLTITPAVMARTTRLLERAGVDVGGDVAAPKSRFQRTRPPIGNDKPICVPREDWMRTNGSYPSGHAMLGWTWALILAELVPDHGDPVLVRGREFGDSRVICGVHFESDVVAGRTLAAALVSRLHADPDFIQDLEAARAEVAKFRASGAAPDCSGI